MLVRALPAVAAALLLVPSAGSAATARSSIVGGEIADPAQWPWVVALVGKGQPTFGGQFCGGTLIAPDAILTAAHCVGSSAPEPEAVISRPQLDTDAGERIEVVRATRHPRYGDRAAGYDVAVLRLARPVAVAPLALVPDGMQLEPADRVRVAGWGLTDESPATLPRALREATVLVRSASTCERGYGRLFREPLMICAGGRPPDSCRGDSGGPLVRGRGPEAVLVGVVSFGGARCANPRQPAVYTSVAAVAGWIAEQLERPVRPGESLHPRNRVRARVANVRCRRGSDVCTVTARVSGVADRVRSVGIRVRRSRDGCLHTGSCRAVERRARARRVASRTYRVRVALPLGLVRVAAYALDADGDVVGDPSGVEVLVVPD